MADIISPLPGIFYRRPGPDKPPFVEEGDQIDVGQTIGIVEIMKQFTEISSTAAGKVGEFAIADQGTVEPGDLIVQVTQ